MVRDAEPNMKRETLPPNFNKAHNSTSLDKPKISLRKTIPNNRWYN